jgi:hypothetical protein
MGLARKIECHSTISIIVVEPNYAIKLVVHNMEFAAMLYVCLKRQLAPDLVTEVAS